MRTKLVATNQAFKLPARCRQNVSTLQPLRDPKMRASQQEIRNMPFHTAHCPSLGWLYYFRTIADAEAFRYLRGGYVLETTPGRIWRVTLSSPIGV